MGARPIPPPCYQGPSGRLYLNSQQDDIPDDVSTLVELDTIDPDFNDGIENWALHKIIIKTAGFYLVKGKVRYTTITIDKMYSVEIWVEGVLRLMDYRHAVSINSVSPEVCDVMYLNKFDDIMLYAKHAAGVATIDIKEGRDSTYLTVQRVR